MVCFAVAVVLIASLGLSWRWENARRDRIYGPPAVVEAHPETEKGEPAVIQDCTDHENHNFRYVY